MEVKYSNTQIDYKIFQKNEIYGLYDRNSNYINNRIENINIIKYNNKKRVKRFLFTLNINKKKLIKKIKEEFEITKSLEKKKLCELSSYELLCILIIKAYLIKSEVIILNHIDALLLTADFKRIMLHIKNTVSKTDKTMIVSVNRLDNIITTTSNYVIASENRIIYNGNNINALHESTDIMKFVDAANKKGAKLTYYKDANDLLKAIYRSVKK